MNYRLACFASIALLCCITDMTAWGEDRQVQPQEDIEEQTFKVSTELVEVRAVVTDRDDRIIEDLKKEDFELLENDQPQEINLFSISQVEERQDKPAGSIRERLSAPPARSTVLYVDNLHLTFRNLNWIKQSLHRFIDEEMTDQDMIAIVTSDGTLGIAQQFTRNRQLLRHAIEQIHLGPISWETPFSATLAGRIERNHFDFDALEEGQAQLLLKESIEDEFGSLTRARARSILSGASYFRETMLLTLEALIDQMTDMPGQRMIAIFSEGFTQSGRDGWPVYDEVKSATNRAARSGVVIYSIDGRGLSAELPDYEKQGALVTLAKDTGGEFYENNNNLSGSLGLAFDANRLYYTLAYYLKPGSDAGKFRNIKVRIRNHPEYRVRTPKGYVPSDLLKAKGEEKLITPQQRLIQAVNAPLPASNFNVSARMDFVEAEADNQRVSLTVYFDGDKFQYQLQDQHHAFTVEILYVIYDSAGKQVDALSTSVQGTLTPDHFIQARTNRYAYSKRLTLNPGVYQARVGVREASTERIGTTSAWVEVPDLKHSKIALSSLIFLDPLPVVNQDADSVNTDELKRITMVQGIRLFPRNSICAYAFRVFSNVNSLTGSDLTMKTELLKSGKPIRQGEWLPLSEISEDSNGKGQIYIGGKENLAGLDPGIYELNVSVKNIQLNKIAQRTEVFGIE